MKNFDELGVSQPLCETLRSKGIRTATPVQEAAIPAVRSGRDVIVQAQTGTGKTLAFLLPIMEKIKSGADNIQALVVTPTRELTIQISKVAAFLGEVIGIKTLAIYGGQDIERQKQKLGRNPQLIVGTPGRILDHMRRRTIDFSCTNKVVLDEADEMLHMGFIEDVEVLLDAMAKDRQLMLFSATMPDRIRSLAMRAMSDPEQITIRAEHVTLDEIEQKIIDTTEDTKLDQLCELINAQQPYLAMVFCHTKQRVGMVAMALARRGYLADELHGDLSQLQRTMVLKKFREAKLQILVTTDIAARGLDIEGVTHVFNYDIPHDAEGYIHRIGRTGRAGQRGMAVTFVNARQYNLLRRIEAGIQSRIDKQRSERSQQKRKAREAQQAKAAGEQKKEAAQKHKPLSKYANRKGAEYKGRNSRSRRKPAAVSPKARTKSNNGRRSKMGRH